MTEMIEALRKHLASLSEEEKEVLRKKLAGPDIPKGWVSIEDHLPFMRAIDIDKGGTKYKVKYDDGTEGTTTVGDHNIWYYYAKEDGITHWFNK